MLHNNVIVSDCLACAGKKLILKEAKNRDINLPPHSTLDPGSLGSGLVNFRTVNRVLTETRMSLAHVAW